MNKNKEGKDKRNKNGIILGVVACIVIWLMFTVIKHLSWNALDSLEDSLKIINEKSQ